jgi:hypothetical protein
MAATCRSSCCNSVADQVGFGAAFLLPAAVKRGAANCRRGVGPSLQSAVPCGMYCAVLALVCATCVRSLRQPDTNRGSCRVGRLIGRLFALKWTSSPPGGAGVSTASHSSQYNSRFSSAGITRCLYCSKCLAGAIRRD